ncbi:hypothetical protein NMD1_00929 [Novosphingobium sp. MD-1]|nr:hypothetical protein NMD1_00929 [Novosphingobium sp. MD-1]
MEGASRLGGSLGEDGPQGQAPPPPPFGWSPSPSWGGSGRAMR